MEILKPSNLAVPLSSSLALNLCYFKSKNPHCLLDLMLTTNVGKELDSVVAHHIRQSASTLFEDVQQNHNLFFNCKIFKCKNYRNIVIKNERCQNEIPAAWITKRFQIIIFKILSNKLLGNNRNKKKILKSLYNFLICAKTEIYNLCELLRKLNIESITWLQSVGSLEQRYILLAKFIKWLFRYFMAIIIKTFNITHVKQERIFILKTDYDRQTKQFFDKLKKKMVVEQIITVDNSSKNSCVLNFIPKKNTLRPLLKLRFQSAQKLIMKKAICIIQHLNKICFTTKNSNFSREYYKMIKESKTFNNSKNYVVCADIVNAYGSIIIEKLLDILRNLFNKLPERLSLKQEIFKKYIKKYTYVKPTEFTTNSRNIEIVAKQRIFEFIENSILNAEFNYNEETYLLCKGIGQGLNLSSVLCDIYYNSMREKYFSEFEKHGFLFHYADDSLYVTKNLNYAELYLKIIEKGIPEYSCRFNKSKLKINFRSSELTKIEYLGWNIISDTLEIEPLYKPARYSTFYFQLSNSILRKKLVNPAALKINKLVLSRNINSEAQILKNINLIVSQYAERFFVWINNIWSNKCGHFKFSLNNLKNTNRKLIEKLIIYTEYEKSNRQHYRNNLKYILWKALYKVCCRKRYRFSKLLPQLKKLIRFYQKKLNECC